jgi:hypothetical protein
MSELNSCPPFYWILHRESGVEGNLLIFEANGELKDIPHITLFVGAFMDSDKIPWS